MKNEGYAVKLRESAISGTFEFHGPGMPQYANSVSFHPDAAQFNAEHVARLLGLAFAAGEAAARAEMRKSMGLTNGPWGMGTR